MTTLTSDERQSVWEAKTGWAEHARAYSRGPVSWITGRRQGTDDEWPRLTVWDHARPVKHSETGEQAYLLMPYGLSEAAADQLTQWCEPRGLRWERVGGEAWWHPATVAVLVRSVA